MEYKNTPKIVNPVVDGLREICARRASTMSYMIDEAKKRGIDDMLEFAQHFGTGHHTDIYEMERVACDEDRLYIDFHYCPYVAEWIKQGRTPEEMDRLCKIAMEGDRAIGETFPAFQFTLGKTIAQGYDVCQIRFDRKK